MISYGLIIKNRSMPKDSHESFRYELKKKKKEKLKYISAIQELLSNCPNSVLVINPKHSII